jgi:hypothetical protein
MEGHNVSIAALPEIGISSAATVAIQLLNDFPPFGSGCWSESAAGYLTKRRKAMIFGRSPTEIVEEVEPIILRPALTEADSMPAVM